MQHTQTLRKAALLVEGDTVYRTTRHGVFALTISSVEVDGEMIVVTGESRIVAERYGAAVETTRTLAFGAS